jgi:phospholipid/cholesterol/gamma-HCH transport system substrate-binding protein
MRRAIRKHLPDFIALTVLFVIALAVSGYVLSHQRLYLPAWVPGVGTKFYEVNAEFSTAQAVVPGQGQTVNIAGVAVGDLGKVELRDGVAVVQMKIREKYAPVYKDARLLLRPKTGLKDMTVELDPGSKSAGEVANHGTIPVENSRPDVNLDEILSQLDRDTRDYLLILANSGGQALGDKKAAADLRGTLKRFEPTNRDLAKINGQLAERRTNLRRVVHNFSALTNEVGTKDKQLSQLVVSANANFRALASQDQNIRESLRLLPGTLRTAKTTLTSANALAKELGPTFSALRPAARALGPSLRATRPFLRDTEPIIRTQLRPFARQARPTVRQLRIAADNLKPLTPNLTRTFRVLNSLLNTVAYNPPGPDEEGYLFWGSWVNHMGATVFSTQDAHGAIRRGVFVASCTSFQLLEQIADTNPNLKVLADLLGAPRSSSVCPTPGDTPSPKAKSGASAKPGATTEKPKSAPASPTPGKPAAPAAPAAATPSTGAGG